LPGFFSGKKPENSVFSAEIKSDRVRRSFLLLLNRSF